MSSLQLTEEQRAAIEEQIASRPSDRRVGVPLTPDQKAAYRRAVEEERAGEEELIARAQMLRAAEQEPGLFGDLRRAINASRIPRDAIANQVGTSLDELDNFRTGTALLPPEVLNRLVSALGLRLMQEIPSRHEAVAVEQSRE